MSMKKETPTREKQAPPAWTGDSVTPWGASSSPWATPSASPATPSFRAIQHQDLSVSLHQQQEKRSVELVRRLMEEQSLDSDEEASINHSEVISDLQEEPVESLAALSSPSCVVSDDLEDSVANDLAIARALQFTFDQEHDLQLDRQNWHRNKYSKVTICNDHMKILPSLGLRDEPSASAAVDILDEDEDLEPTLPPCGYMEVDGKVVTKHDQNRASRQITRKMMKNLPCDVNMGDTASFPIRMESNVFNSLKSIGNKDTKRKARKHDQAEKATLSNALDASSTAVVMAMLNTGVLDEFGGAVSTGKEAVVFGATIGQVDGVEVDTPCAIKVFKTRIVEFKTREKYIRDDHRFSGRLSKTNAMTNLLLWSEKEYRNLHRVHRANIPCPEPFYMRKNVLAMSFIGHTNTEPAPQLKNVDLNASGWQKAYEETLEIVRAMVRECHLVHADLSEYNLLYHTNKVFVIDFAQSVDITHGEAFSYLYRDLCTIANFFKRRGVECVKSGLELLEEITGISLSDCNELPCEGKVEATEEMLRTWRNSDVCSDSAFEFLWTQSQVRHQMLASVRHDQPDLETLCLPMTGDAYTEEWIMKKTDAAVSGKLIKKRRRRKASGCKAEGKGAVKEEEEEDDGFCLVVCDGPRVRFADVSDAADTTDYNADADTDAGSTYSPRCSGDDSDQPVAADSVTDTGGETEGGYAADGDDTEGDCYFSPPRTAPSCPAPGKKKPRKIASKASSANKD